MNWFSLFKLANLDVLLERLNLSPDIVQFIKSSPNQQKPLYVAYVRKNPQATLEDLKNIQTNKAPKSPYYPPEERLSNRLPPKAVQWALVQFKKLRNSRLDLKSEFIENLMVGNPARLNNLEDFQEYIEFSDQMKEWIRANELTDFLTNQPNYDINSHDWRAVADDVVEWHAAMAGQGEGSFYNKTDEDLIVYGPEWVNPKFNGWTVQEVKTDNDLKTEGGKMSHCVGSYCQRVKDLYSRIFSLRDPNNEPKVTIETDALISHFRQIFGYGNAEPKDEYKPMIKEWVIQSGINATFEDDSDLGNFNSLADMSVYFENVEKVLSGDYDHPYGLKPDFSTNLDWDDLLDTMFHFHEHETKSWRRQSADYDDKLSDMIPYVLDTAALIGPESVYNLIIAAQNINQKAYENNEWLYEYEYSEPEPDRDDFETDEEYQEAFSNWETQEEEYRDEQQSEAANKIPQIGFYKELDDKYDEYVRHGKLPEFDYLMQANKGEISWDDVPVIGKNAKEKAKQEALRKEAPLFYQK